MKSPSVTFLATLYLVCYFITFEFESLREVGAIMFLFSPVVLVWLVYTVIRYGSYKGPELGEKEEFGYQDREKESLGWF